MSWQKFTYRVLLFLLPVVAVITVIEAAVRHIPNSVNISSKQLEKEANTIETLILGSSQNKRAINPEYLSKPALTVAGTRQGHKTDYYLIKDLHKQLPNLKRVVIGATYRHFESRPNPKNFWKYRSHLLYYNVNAFERTVYFKDKLLYLGNTNFYSDQLTSYYLNDERSVYNTYGFQIEGQRDKFAKLGYDKKAILKTYKPNNYPDLNIAYIDLTTDWFHKVLAYCQTNNLEVILTQTPTYKLYRDHQDTDVLYRRDSIVKAALATYSNIRLLNEEESTSYRATHYLNENHLNPAGAEIFTKKLDAFLKGD